MRRAVIADENPYDPPKRKLRRVLMDDECSGNFKRNGDRKTEKHTNGASSCSSGTSMSLERETSGPAGKCPLPSSVLDRNAPSTHPTPPDSAQLRTEEIDTVPPTPPDTARWPTDDIEDDGAGRDSDEVPTKKLSDYTAEATRNAVKTSDGNFTIKPFNKIERDNNGSNSDMYAKQCRHACSDGLSVDLLKRLETAQNIQTCIACCLVLPQTDTLRFHTTKYRPSAHNLHAVRQRSNDDDNVVICMQKCHSDILLLTVERLKT